MLNYQNRASAEGLVGRGYSDAEGLLQGGDRPRQDIIRRAPHRVALVCFGGGVSTVTVAILHLVGKMGRNATLLHYVLNVYMLFFGFTTVFLEVDVDAADALPNLAAFLLQIQMWLRRRVELLTDFHGRAFFYMYQGTLLMTQGCTVCGLFAIGSFNILMGMLCGWLAYRHWGKNERRGLWGLDDLDRPARFACEGPMSSRPPGSEYHYTATPLVCEQEFDQRGLDLPLAGTKPNFRSATEGMFSDEAGIQEERYCHAVGLFEAKRNELRLQDQYRLEALRRQAEEGDCRSKKPTGMFNAAAKSKWDAWNALQGMGREAARLRFVEVLRMTGVRE
jgi:acyl-CoA-binding protein